MESCKNCQTEVTTHEAICTICQYPIQGTEKERVKFMARQINQKSDVEEALKRIKNARGLLFVLAIIYLLTSLYFFIFANDMYGGAASIIFSFALVACGIISNFNPKIAFMAPLGLFVSFYIALLFYDPMLVWQGIFWKVIIITGLGYGFFSAIKSNKILKENPYLAAQFDNKKA